MKRKVSDVLDHDDGRWALFTFTISCLPPCVHYAGDEVAAKVAAETKGSSEGDGDQAALSDATSK